MLNNARLGLASLADGDPIEAERSLGRVFDLLSTAGLNSDRTTAAVMLHEGVRIWKGEPFEQALMYSSIASLYATMNDWENARAAAANSLFRLTDFGTDQDQESLARQAAHDEEYLDAGYTAVDTNFALGFLLQAIGTDLTGATGADRQFDAALQIDSDLQPIVDALRSREYDTLLIVDYGKGPTKIAHGPDNALSKFVPQDFEHGSLRVETDGAMPLRFARVADVNAMAVDHRWNNLEDVRRAKSAIGQALMFGGTFTSMYGASQENEGAFFAGMGLIAAGLLARAGAQADTRYLEFIPASIYVAPLRLDQVTDLRISIDGDTENIVVLTDVQPGQVGRPHTMYLRLLGRGARATPQWLTASTPIHGNDFTGVLEGDFPWILGGRDVSTPSQAALDAYQSAGYLTGMTLRELEDLYREEGIVMGSGMERSPIELKNPSFRHVLEGGRGLFTPQPGSMGYKRLMFQRHDPYEPTLRRVRALAESIAAQNLASHTYSTESSTSP